MTPILVLKPQHEKIQPELAVDQHQILQGLPISGYALFMADNLNDGVKQMLASSEGEYQQTKFSS